MCSAAASSELGPAPGWRVRGGGAGATPLYTDNLQRGYRVVTANTEITREPVADGADAATGTAATGNGTGKKQPPNTLEGEHDV